MFGATKFFSQMHQTKSHCVLFAKLDLRTAELIQDSPFSNLKRRSDSREGVQCMMSTLPPYSTYRTDNKVSSQYEHEHGAVGYKNEILVTVHFDETPASVLC